jgi:membrane fusion protein (multidrug efflux system)
VRARLPEGTRPNGILVPQKGVTRDATGRATALVVTADRKVERRSSPPIARWATPGW